MTCQYCGNDKAEYNKETLSSALCAECTKEFESMNLEPYDYPNEREYCEGIN